MGGCEFPEGEELGAPVEAAFHKVYEISKGKCHIGCWVYSVASRYLWAADNFLEVITIYEAVGNVQEDPGRDMGREGKGTLDESQRA